MPENYVRLDPAKLESVLQEKCIGPDEAFKNTKLDKRTARRILRGDSVRWSTARVALEALGVTEFTKFFASDLSEPQSPLAAAVANSHVVGQWQHDGPISPLITTSNDLSYQLFRLRHRHVRDRVGRGKRYDLTGQDERIQNRLRESLLRHPNTCESIGRHPQIPVCRDTFPDAVDDGWWVVDEWIDGQTLDEALASGPFRRKRLARVMRQIAEGLQAFHGAQIIRRELSPRFVVLRESSDDVVLSEFELAKMLDRSPTVSRDWPEDAYRAPEVDSGNVSPASDIYSWARILVRAATGETPKPGTEAAALQDIALPDSVRQIVLDSLHALPSQRPQSIDMVLKAIKSWR